MKKILIALSCSAVFGLHAQNTQISVLIPWKSNGYISWEKVPQSTFKVNVYQLINNTYRLIESNSTGDNYFRFTSSYLMSSDLFYTIAVYDATGRLVNEGQPAAIGNTPPPAEICYIDCNGLRESYRLSFMQQSNGATTFLKATDDAGTHDPETGLYAPYYQAINEVSYNQFDPLHPYRYATASPSGLIYQRDHIQITPNTPGGPYFDAQNNPVTNGWLVEKKMDKYLNFQGSNSGNYLSDISWCEANIGSATTVYNQHVDPATVLPGPVGEQNWFLNHSGTTDQGLPIYIVPDALLCTANGYGGSGSGGGSIPYGELMDQMIDCFTVNMNPEDPDYGEIIDCLSDSNDDNSGGGFGGTLSGVSFESIDKRFFLSMDNSHGPIRVKGTYGRMEPGLYRINTFLTDGRIIPLYRVLGVKPLPERVIDFDISPNTIQNSELKFGITANLDTPANILVQKLDGTTVHTESVTLVANTTLYRTIPVSGTIPYNQLRVSIILQDGTTIQKTALTE